jgi:hypothetical protein
VVGRRLLLLLAVLLALTVLAAGVAPRQPVTPVTPRASAQPTPPPATPEPSPGGAQLIERTLRAQPGAEPPRVRARVGDTIRLEVHSTEIDSVLIDELDKLEPVDPQSPARFEVFAERPGSYAITLLDAGSAVGSLEVRP